MALKTRRVCKVAGLCFCWYLFSSCNNVINKKFLNQYPYPVTITLSHMFANAFYMYPVLLTARISTKISVSHSNFWKFIVPLGFGKLLGSTLSQVSVWKVPVSYAHTVKAMMPIFTVVFARILFHQKHTIFVYMSLIPIISGVAIATVTELSFDIFGMISAIFAAMSFSLQTMFSKVALRRLELYHLQLLVRISQISFVLALPLWCMTDFAMLLRDHHLQTPNEVFTFISILGLSGFINFAQSVVAFSVLSLLSPLSYSVMNAAKRILVITVSLVSLRNPVTPVNICGMMIAIFGVLLYNKAKLEQNKKQESLPTSSKEVHVHSPTRFRLYNSKPLNFI